MFVSKPFMQLSLPRMKQWCRFRRPESWLSVAISKLEHLTGPSEDETRSALRVAEGLFKACGAGDGYFLPLGWRMLALCEARCARRGALYLFCFGAVFVSGGGFIVRAGRKVRGLYYCCSFVPWVPFSVYIPG